MSKYIGFDAPALSPAAALRAYFRIHAACDEARTVFDAYAKGVTYGPSGIPSAAVERRMDQYQARFSELAREDAEAKASAIAAMRGLGVGVGSGGVRLDGRLFVLVKDEFYGDAPAFIVVVALDQVVDL